MIVSARGKRSVTREPVISGWLVIVLVTVLRKVCVYVFSEVSGPISPQSTQQIFMESQLSSWSGTISQKSNIYADLPHEYDEAGFIIVIL